MRNGAHLSLELPKRRFKLSGFFTLNDFVDAMTPQINK